MLMTTATCFFFISPGHAHPLHWLKNYQHDGTDEVHGKRQLNIIWKLGFSLEFDRDRYLQVMVRGFF